MSVPVAEAAAKEDRQRLTTVVVAAALSRPALVQPEANPEASPRSEARAPTRLSVTARVPSTVAQLVEPASPVWQGSREEAASTVAPEAVAAEA